MCEENQTQVTEIHLLGFRGLYKYKILLFIVFLLTYTLIMGGNLVIILLVSTTDHLKTPMYFFLKHLSTADVLLTTSIVPVMLHIILFEGGTLPLWFCIMQLYCFIGIFGFVQCYIIAVMSFDRYLAICHPLRYSSLMGPDLCLQLVIGSWSSVTVITSSELFVAIQFNFCGLNYVDHFFCDFGPTMELATSDISSLLLQDFVNSILMMLFPFTLIIVTYFCIFFTILRMSSTNIYMAPSDESSSEINKYQSLLYIVVTPLVNPIIYSLRNHEIKRALMKIQMFRVF
ncbi:hypothetical protein GDO81_008931 [Engystomops pustulosus]|uniref:G-protein coupled receptors family 1 profile domain-containing protein n=1 Tax=Engystomops pustulosus TaxID=76066 RepID=A0AAV7BNU4_ENGPU|nr:hypothetical protein GDO81_008931 [Engystomops pustulosus]